ncbi:MAG: YjjI family glycine radical enzyme [Desulfobacteraceae bacterium]|nr:YjjI family glycine radical enzyme [Desulfobacteraceae bacterium]
MSDILALIKDKSLTYHQKLYSLGMSAENTLDCLNFSGEAQRFFKENIICDLHEGSAPYKPRYIVPNYEKFLENGSEFLRLEPPKNLLEACNALLILYKNVPSITSFPVYLGNLDTLLNPYIKNEDYAYDILKSFLIHIDRTLTSSFVHANIGPKRTLCGEMILTIMKELKNTVPNLTLKYKKDVTDDKFLLKAIENVIETASPNFANDDIYQKDFKSKYGIVSCYNALPIGGGAHTLIRLNLKNLALSYQNFDHYLKKGLPHAVKIMSEIIDERSRFLVEESGFFESSFLVKENLIEKDNFLSMFGIFGMAEAVNCYLKDEKYGHSEKAHGLTLQILEVLENETSKIKSPYCYYSNGRPFLHAQSGISSDKDVSPGCRIPIGDEPDLFESISYVSEFHKYFPAGISDIFSFESTVKNNPQYLLDVIKASMKKKLRMVNFYTHDSDLIRITGFLVKKSEIEKRKSGTPSLNDATVLGEEAVLNCKTYERRIQK